MRRAAVGILHAFEVAAKFDLVEHRLKPPYDEHVPLNSDKVFFAQPSQLLLDGAVIAVDRNRLERYLALPANTLGINRLALWHYYLFYPWCINER